MPFLALIFLILILGFSPGPAVAQTDPLADYSSTPLRVNVDVVNLAFHVFDKNQRQVEDLQKGDLILYEDGVQQEISLFGAESSPLSIIVLLDVSESLAPFSKQMRAVNRLIPRLIEQGDEVALIAFSDTPTLLLDFTEDKNRLGMALEQTLLSAKESASASDAIYFEGSTNINDSVFLASKKLETAGYERRRVIVLVSDGMGNRGESIRASEELKFSGAALLNIGVGLTSKFHRGSMLMHRWIKESGGAMVLYSREAEMHDNLQTAFQRIRSRYGIAYSPSNRKKDGMYRRVRLEIARNSPYALRNLTIRGSHGYFAPLDISRPSNGNALFNVSKMGEPRTFEPKDFAHPVIGESSVETLFGNH